MDDNPERRQGQKCEEKALMKYMMSFPTFVWSSLIDAKQLGSFSLPDYMFQKALLEAMTCQVSHQSRKELLVCGGLRRVLVERMFFPYTCSRIPVNASLLKYLIACVFSQKNRFPKSKCVATLEGHRDYVSCVAVHPTGKFLATGSKDNTVKLWQLSDDNSSATYVANIVGGCMHSVSCVEFDHSGKFMGSGSEDNNVNLWQMSSDNSFATCTETLLGCRSSERPPLGGMTFVVPHRSRIQKIVNPEMQAWRESIGHSGAVTSVAFHPTAPLFATGSFDKTVRLWLRLSNGKCGICVANLKEHSECVSSVVFDPSGRFLATGSWDKTAKLWRLSSYNSSATCVATLEGHSDYVSCVAFHPTAPLLATSSADGTVKLWRLSSDNSSATCVATLEGHSDYVLSVAFHPTAPLLATSSADKTAKLWRLSSDNSSATCVGTLQGHRFSVTSVAFHPTAPLLVTSSADKTAKLWC